MIAGAFNQWLLNSGELQGGNGRVCVATNVFHTPLHSDHLVSVSKSSDKNESLGKYNYFIRCRVAGRAATPCLISHH